MNEMVYYRRRRDRPPRATSFQRRLLASPGSLLTPWRSHAHRCQTPLSPMRVRPPEHASCVGGYLQACFRELLRPSLSGAPAERAAFSRFARSSSSIWRPARLSSGSASPTTCCLVRRRCDISLLLLILRHFCNWPLDYAVGLSVAPGRRRDSSAGLLFG